MHVQLFNAFLCTSLTKIASLWSSAVPLVRIAASAQGLLELRSEINTIVEQHQRKINEWLYFKLCESKLKNLETFTGFMAYKGLVVSHLNSLRNSRTSRVSPVRPEVRKITQRPKPEH